MSNSLATPWIWMDGGLIPWDEGRVHLLTHSLHYGLGVFEGTRAYRQNDGSTAVFRLQDHLLRFKQSARIVRIDLPFDHDEMVKATLDLVEANELESCYLRHLAFIGDGSMGVDPGDNPIRLAIASWKWGAYLGEEGMRKGVRLAVSTHARLSFASSFNRAKATGNYITSVLAKREAVLRGYDDCVMLDANGYVAESSGANLFIVRDGVLKTPPPPAILPGITRDTVMWLAEQRGWKVLQMPFARDEMYSADEVFLTGTAAEVTPVREIDDRPIGEGAAGPYAIELQQAYLELVRDQSTCPEGWSTAVPTGELVEA
ncbi:MAG: branched-chain amino acid transaminase [Thermoanaerobaculia bacterium]